MHVTIKPSKAAGAVTVPPSKSMAHRALICGALSAKSSVQNVAYSKDIAATIDCLRGLGAKIEQEQDSMKTGGLNPFDVPEGTELFCNESGSTLRFFIPLCMLSGRKITLSGSDRLFERPLTIYEDICKEQGILFEKSKNSVTVCGKLKGGNYIVPGDVSSQFISGLLFALPLLMEDSVLTVTGKFESASYIDLTVSMLSEFGIVIERNENVFHIKGGQKYENNTYTVEGDCSNAAFLDGFNLLGGEVVLNGLKMDTLQGDRVYSRMFYGLQKGEKQFDLSDCPDLGPVMFAMAAYLGGAAFSGTARLRIKESDRAAAMAEELAKFGIVTEVQDNTVIVHGGTLAAPCEVLHGHNDHRIVMALSLLCSITGGTIDDAQAVSKSFPDFFEKIASLGIDVEFACENEKDLKIKKLKNL